MRASLWDPLDACSPVSLFFSLWLHPIDKGPSALAWGCLSLNCPHSGKLWLLGWLYLPLGALSPWKGLWRPRKWGWAGNSRVPATKCDFKSSRRGNLLPHRFLTPWGKVLPEESQREALSSTEPRAETSLVWVKGWFWQNSSVSEIKRFYWCLVEQTRR